MLNGETLQTNDLTGVYIIEISKLKHLKRYMNIFEIEYIHFERKPQRHQLSTTFHLTIE